MVVWDVVVSPDAEVAQEHAHVQGVNVRLRPS